MIYRCYGCGWRINERRNVTDIKKIGSHLLYDHKPFCSDGCIQQYKCQKNKPTTAPITDWHEEDNIAADNTTVIYGWKSRRKNGNKYSSTDQSV